MKRWLIWTVANSDILIALALAVLLSILGLAGRVSAELLDNATVLTMAALGFVLLHDRIRRDAATVELKNDIQSISEAVRSNFEVQTLSGDAIGHALAKARRRTEIWFFKGSTATFVRAVTLPECVDAARRDRRPLIVRLEILDPTNIGLCERYTRLYRQLAQEPGAPELSWTVKNTRAELYATILAACWYRARYELLEIDVALSSVVTTFRWEMSSGYFILTQQGPRFPATLVEKGHLYFDCWATEIRTSFLQGRRLLIDSVSNDDLSREPTVDEVRHTFRLVGVEPPADFTDEEIAEVCRLALRDTDPYGPLPRPIDRR